VTGQKSFSVLANRLSSIDELRALAIISMIIAHFGPGTFERIPALARLADPILFCGRFATVTFILVFGLTLGFVYYHRFHSLDRQRTFARLRARAGIVLACAIIICIPQYAEVWYVGPTRAAQWLWATYSVLDYYVLALLSAPFWLIALGRNPLRNACLLSVTHWVLAAVVLCAWPGEGELSPIEFARFVLVSGPYGYLQLTGCALMAVPVGYYLRKALHDGTHRRVLERLLLVGACLAVTGYLIGELSGEFDIQAMIAGTVKAPPRIWYWMFFAGPALLALVLLVAIELHAKIVQRWLYPLALVGRAALPIFTAHVFVLPGLALLDRVVVIEGTGRVIVALAIFGLFSAAVTYRYHRINQWRMAANGRAGKLVPGTNSMGSARPVGGSSELP
jgi:hypothetical protein